MAIDPLGKDISRPGNEDREHWDTPGEAVSIVCEVNNLKNTVTIALIVGTVLFIINQLDVVLRGEATWFVWFKVGLTYFVPFGVSNVGILTVTKRDKRQERARP